MAQKSTAKLKKRKKKWIPLMAPGLFGNRVLGELPVYEAPQAMGRCITVNYMVLTGDMKKQHLNIGFRVMEVNDGKAQTEVYTYKIIPSLLKRFVRKGREKIDDSFVAQTSDGKFVRVKPMLITNSTTHRSVVTNLRTTTKKLLQNVISTYSYPQFVEEVLSYKLQKFIRDHLHKIYPIKICEIRDFSIIDVAPRSYSFQKEDIADIIKKSRDKIKNRENGRKQDSDQKDDGETDAADAGAEDGEAEKVETSKEDASEEDDQDGSSDSQ